MNNMFSKAAIWAVILLVLFMLFKQFDNHGLASGATPIAYSDFLDDVFAQAVCIGERRAGFVDAAVNRAAEMFEKRAEDAAVEIGAHARSIEHNARRAGALGLREPPAPGAGSQRRGRCQYMIQEFTSVG